MNDMQNLVSSIMDMRPRSRERSCSGESDYQELVSENMRRDQAAQCCTHYGFRLSFRLTASLYCVILMITDVYFYAKLNYVSKWPIYLTNWTQVVVTCFFILGVIKSILNFRGAPVSRGFRSFINRFRSVSLVASVIVTVNYWLLVRPTMTVVETPLLSIQVHGVACAIVILDMFLSRNWIREENILEVVLFFLLFVIWTIVFHFLGLRDADGNHFIYKVMDWSKPKIVFSVIGAQIVVVIPTIYAFFQFVGYLLGRGAYRAEIRMLRDQRKGERKSSKKQE